MSESGLQGANIPIIDPRTGRATNAFWRLLERLWRRTGGFDDTLADLAARDAALRALITGLETEAAGAQGDVEDLQRRFAPLSVDDDVRNEVAALRREVEIYRTGLIDMQDDGARELVEIAFRLIAAFDPDASGGGVSGGGAVTSVFGRTGAVASQAGDYDTVQVNYDNASSGLAATNAQDAIDELAGGVSIGDFSDVTLSTLSNADMLVVSADADVLVLNFEGADASTSTTDESGVGHAITFTGAAEIDTAQFKFGSSSLLVPGGGARVSAPDGTPFEFGNGLWTIQGWFRWTSDPNAFQCLIGKWQSSGNQRAVAIFRDGAGNTLELFMSVNGSSSLIDIVSPAFNPTLGTWYHIAADFDGTTYRLYIDGVVQGTSTTVRDIFDGSAAFAIGAQNNGADPFNGHVDSVRVDKGAALFAGAFAPPASVAQGAPATFTNRAARLKSFTVAGVPSAADLGAGTLIYVTDETGGAVPAFSDGTNWRRTTDRAVVS